MKSPYGGVWSRACIGLTSYLLCALPAGGEECSRALRSKPGVIIPPKIVARLESIATAFCDEQTKARRQPTTIVVTAGTRSTGEEAALLEQKLREGSDLGFYENQAAVQEVRQAYRNRQSIRALLDDQVRRGCFISKHLFDQAADIRNSDMDDASQSRFVRLTTESGARIVESEGGVRDHFHLNFPPYLADPKACPK